MNRSDLPELLKYWRTFPAPSNEVAAADIIEELEQLLRKAESQRDDFRRQSAAERDGRMAAERIVDEVRARNRELEAKLNAPELIDFREAIVLEAAHQRERWGTEHDEGKTAEDWMWLVAFLSTKATQANRYGDAEKYLHHIITCAAACANWHAHASGANTVMRPGVDPAKYG